MIKGRVYTKSGEILNVQSHNKYSLMKDYRNEEDICEFYLKLGNKLYIPRKNIDFIIIEDSPSN